MSPLPNRIDKDSANVSGLARRLVARINLTDDDDETSRKARRPSGHGFWSDDFLRTSERSLMPKADADQLPDSFAKYADQIDKEMRRICQA